MVHMIEFIQSISESELRFISNLDYGCGSEKHYEALKQIIFNQSCIGNYDQSWYPYEVIELGAHWLQEAHEREFTICTLLVIHNVINGNDGSTELGYNFECRASDYDLLSKTHQELVMSAYERSSI